MIDQLKVRSVLEKLEADGVQEVRPWTDADGEVVGAVVAGIEVPSRLWDRMVEEDRLIEVEETPGDDPDAARLTEAGRHELQHRVAPVCQECGTALESPPPGEATIRGDESSRGEVGWCPTCATWRPARAENLEVPTSG